MRWYHYILLFLKVLFIAQFGLIIYNKNYVRQEIYLVTEILFKLLLALYIEFLVIFTLANDVNVEDKLCITFASGLLGYDAIVNDLPKLLKLYGIPFSPFT